jgi:hypothetical protein
MKTAMQLMLEDLELRYKVLSNAEMLQACGAIEGTIDYAKSLIIKEKEQIMDAYCDGAKGGANGNKGQHENGWVSIQMRNKYYNQTYNN